jgi:hypothetical protein
VTVTTVVAVMSACVLRHLNPQLSPSPELTSFPSLLLPPDECLAGHTHTHTHAQAKNTAKGMILKAEAEAKAVENLKVKREYELEWKRLGIMEHIAQDGRKVLTGASADRILEEVIVAGFPAGGSKKR